MQFVCMFVYIYIYTASFQFNSIFPLFSNFKSNFLGLLNFRTKSRNKTETRLPRKEDYTHLFKGLEKEEALTKARIKNTGPGQMI